MDNPNMTDDFDPNPRGWFHWTNFPLSILTAFAAKSMLWDFKNVKFYSKPHKIFFKAR